MTLRGKAADGLMPGMRARHDRPFRVAMVALAACALPLPAAPIYIAREFPPAPSRVLGPTHIIDPTARATASIRLAVRIDVSRVQSMDHIARWAEHAAALCKVWYPILCAELDSEGFTPRESIALVFSPDEDVPAQYSDGAILINVRHLNTDLTNYGMVIHELVHAVQSYPPWRAGRAERNPDWLVEGIADYIRYYLYEVDPDHAWIDPKHPERSKYTDSYRTTACFLDYVVRRYDRDIVKKFNRLLRRGGVTRREIEDTVATDENVGQPERRSIDVLFQAFLAEWKKNHREIEKKQNSLPLPAPADGRG